MTCEIKCEYLRNCNSTNDHFNGTNWHKASTNGSAHHVSGKRKQTQMLEPGNIRDTSLGYSHSLLSWRKLVFRSLGSVAGGGIRDDCGSRERAGPSECRLQPETVSGAVLVLLRCTVQVRSEPVLHGEKPWRGWRSSSRTKLDSVLVCGPRSAQMVVVPADKEVGVNIRE